MKTSRSRVMNALLSAGVICLIALFATYSTSAQQTKGKGKADAKVAVNTPDQLSRLHHRHGPRAKRVPKPACG